MEPSQFINRFSRRFRTRFLYPWVASYLFPPPSSLNGKVSIPPDIFEKNLLTEDSPNSPFLREAEALAKNRFAFLNLPPVHLPFPVDWRFAPIGNRLWQYNLHYGEWALTLSQAFITTRNTAFRQSLVRLLEDWIDQNPVGHGPGWEPYPLSRRLVAWSRVALNLWEDRVWQSFWRSRLAPSLHQQASFLAANLEFDLVNNHLLANYRALAWLGLLFSNWPESAVWQEKGLNGLWSEMDRQVLSDGAHDERSISYHTIVLQDLLETWWLTEKIQTSVPESAAPTLSKMLQFLVDTQTPGDTWPMVNDSVPGYPVDPRTVLLAGGMIFDQPQWISQGIGGDSSYPVWLTGRLPSPSQIAIKSKRLAVYPEAGYAVLRPDNQHFLFFDAGPLGPRRMPGHGHADALSIVLYGAGRPLIVDPGVYTYEGGAWRDYFRSTAAHNTVTIDGENQCVFWGAFRVAYAPTARLVDWSKQHLIGEHNGYHRLSQPVLHRRRIEVKSPGVWEIIDQFEGTGNHEFTLNLQFTPDAQAAVSGQSGEVRWPDGVILRIISLSAPAGATARVESGWISSGWNLKEKAPRYRLQWQSRVPVGHRLLLEVVD